MRVEPYLIADIENDKFSLPPWKTLMKYRVVISSCLDAGILAAAHCTNTALMRIEGEVIRTLHPHRLPKNQVTPHWTHLIIDEVIVIVMSLLLSLIWIYFPGGTRFRTRTFGSYFSSFNSSTCRATAKHFEWSDSTIACASNCALWWPSATCVMMMFLMPGHWQTLNDRGCCSRSNCHFRQG